MIWFPSYKALEKLKKRKKKWSNKLINGYLICIWVRVAMKQIESLVAKQFIIARLAAHIREKELMNFTQMVRFSRSRIVYY